MTKTTGTWILKDAERKGVFCFVNQIGRIDAEEDTNIEPEKGVLNITIFSATPTEEAKSKEDLVKNIIQVLIGCFSKDGEETVAWWNGVSQIKAKIHIGGLFSEDFFTSYNVPIVVLRDAHVSEDIFNSWYSRYNNAKVLYKIISDNEWGFLSME